jgi:hypothetical protein
MGFVGLIRLVNNAKTGGNSPHNWSDNPGGKNCQHEEDQKLI